tara:strand:+ start:1055 stop:1852 length:798 start_codon:yes stop_codon:yes gene_type:complete
MNLGAHLNSLRNTNPLVHNITNFVVMNYTANALLAIGASPVMAHAVEEVEEMASISNALVINIGTLSRHWVEGMKLAVTKAKNISIPIILDPVGAGATTFRNNALKDILGLGSPAIIRGNSSEIMALAGINSTTKGVDSTASSSDALAAGKQLASILGCIVSISGETDIIIDIHKTAYITNGHAIMTKVTGMGCTASAIAGAFAAVVSDPFTAAMASAAAMGVCGEIAVNHSNLPGTFQMHFLDALSTLSPEELNMQVKIKIENN